ncbi:MAG: acyl-CoA thioesterase [Lachnospiraceae bacterium]|nr:acyl-CoA thioesterase [Lachnospiraceae bacterium]
MSSHMHTVQYYETDKMGITHHSNYIRFMEEARMHLLAEMGFPMTRFEEAGIVSPVVSVHCDYKHSTTFCDAIAIDAKITGYTGARISLEYTMTNEKTGDIVANAASTHCFTDKTGRPLALRKIFPELDGQLKEAVKILS